MKADLLPLNPGARVGHLLVLRRSEERRARIAMWECLCDCGAQKLVRHDHLRSARVRSCGCLKAGGNHRTHGKTNTAEYGIWSKMRGRCLNPTNDAFKDYGARGITVAERWDDFANFLADLGPRPSPDHQLERRENDGPYSPDNCYWATASEQANNKRNTVWIDYRGSRITLSDAVRLTGFRRKTIRERIRRGWSGERIIETPLLPSRWD